MSRIPDVSVVITSFNTRVMLEECLRSVFRDLEHSRLRFEVIVVDDASTDGSPEMVAKRFPRVRLLPHTINRGYARSNNAGVRIATGATIVLLNSDTVVTPGSISRMFQTLTPRTDIAAVGPKLLNPDGTVQRSCWRFPLRSLVGNTLLLFRAGIWDDYRSFDHRADKEVDCITSAALMIRRPVLEDVGLFDEAFWVYGVDIDWALRARRKGYRCLSLASASVIHHGRASWHSAYERMSWDDMRADSLLFRKHYGVPGLVLYRGAVLLNSTLRVVFWGLLYLFGNRQLADKVAYFKYLARWSVLGSSQDLPPHGG